MLSIGSMVRKLTERCVANQSRLPVSGQQEQKGSSGMRWTDQIFIPRKRRVDLMALVW